MMKMKRKWGAVLLSLAMALSLAVPALAVSADQYAILNVIYEPNVPNGNTFSGVEYKAYKLATATLTVDEDGSSYYTYELTEAFKGAVDYDINDILDGRHAGEKGASSEGLRKMLGDFGTYINDNLDAVRANAGPDDIKEAVTGEATVGTDRSASLAQFTGLSDGVYLVTTRHAVEYDRTTYTPVPFIVNIPFMDGGVANNYLTARVKFVDETEDPEDPPPPENPPGNPPSPDNPPDTPPSPDTPPETPETPDVPVTPETPVTPEVAPEVTPEVTPEEAVEEPVEDDFLLDIEPDDVPLAEPEIEILPDEVPLAEMIDELDDPEDPEIEIIDPEVPLSTLPQTGLLWWPVPLMAVAGSTLVVGGAVVKKKDRDA